MKQRMRWIWVLASVAGAGCVMAAETTAPSSSPAAPSAPTNQAAPAGQYNFGNFTSETLATKGWEALKVKDYAAVEAYTNKCIDLYEKKAIPMAQGMTEFAPKERAFSYWAVNDVATCYFIKGQALLEQGKTEEAKQVFQSIITKFPYAQCWDPKGWFWKVAEGAQDKLDTIGTSYDFGDYTSETLTTKAWNALGAGDYRGVELYTNKCIKLFEEEAKKQQASLKEPIDWKAEGGKDKAFSMWALNDVATCYFIRGKALLEQGKTEEAKQAFTTVVEQLSFGQCWDPKGWFWTVAGGAKDQLNTIGTPYDFGDYTSMTLTVKGWEALNAQDHKGVEIYTNKCIELYEKDAHQQQAALKEPIDWEAEGGKDKAFAQWALNDVATCYFIKGMSLQAQGKIEESKAAYEKVIKDFPYALCWDPNGWFWKPADGANDKLSTMGTPYDFGDYKSVTLTVKAWEALGANDHKGVEIYTKKCMDLFEDDAKKQQASLKEFAPKEKAFDYWALNDVATCYFILGESLMAQKRYKEAKAAFERVVNDFSFAQCWDPQGWFWKVAVGSRGRINKIIALGEQ